MLDIPDTGASRKPQSRVPKSMPTAPMIRKPKLTFTVAVTTPLVCSARIKVKTPTEVRALLAPCAKDKHRQVITCDHNISG